MSLRKNETFDSVLRNELKIRGLPGSTILGRSFMFGSEQGSHHEVIAGTITGVSFSDEGFLVLYVSVPRFWGKPLVGIQNIGDVWEAQLAVEPFTIDKDVLSKMSEEVVENRIQQHLSSRFVRGTFTL